MAKKKQPRKPMLNPDAYRQKHYKSIPLPSGYRMMIRPLTLAELAEHVATMPAVADEVMELGEVGISELRSSADIERIPIFLQLTRACAVAVAVKPKLTAEPTDKPGELYVRDLSFEDLDELFRVACELGGIKRELLEQAGQMALTRPALQPIPPEFAHLGLEELPGMNDPEIRRKTIENCQVAAQVMAAAPRLTGKE